MTQTSSGRRPDESMTLLTTVVERPLDPGYAAAADRREAAGEPRSTSLRSPLLVVATLVIGLVLGIAAYNLSAASTPRSKARAELITQIERRRSQVEELTARATTLQSKVTDLEAEQLAGDPDAGRNRDLAAVVGSIPLEGPGFTITVDDAPDAVDQDATEGGSDTTDEGRVLAKDLQFVTNELWRSGAEAISINGKRLTSTSAIRFAGSAVIVDYRPLTRPYVITALGDPQRFPATFADGPGGTYLSTLASTFGIRVDTKVSNELRVPAAVGLTTRYATTGDTGDSDTTPTPTATPTPTPGRSTS
jgi:uncharacterized protein YlxW (UPF0749 family)